MKKRGTLDIIQQRPIARNIFEITCSGDLVQEMQEPGQFLHVKIDQYDDLLLRRPISICDVNLDKNEMKMIYRAEGEGTTRLSGKKPEATLDILGPLGHGFPVEEAKPGESVLLVGGGIGVPPLYYLGKELLKKDVHVTTILGFQSKQDVFYEEEFAELGPVYVATVDGSYGTKGFVTDAIDEKHASFDVLYSCGPTPMLASLTERYREKRVFLSLEERMGCGIGACFACVCHVESDPEGTVYRKVCTDGPVFPVGEVVL
ncbi:dihydroorotate dehydrogenase electron transfer subunit [Alkalicoccobacillus murimartini]|uniref:Dihydroorotate dehydrogenase B (NAD(+)), electron transfer subunit n=1 Tax=Alkalicoccobacillus murimartini TaxID=171685 RepID=A0ABT9YEZ3_9BACI|nr:dihydroorotate dehydrogenase electron transfer subunit [Alkalicoccobacillus murimartini]MDQ0206419.1 dihydroorotate dehydrogenase electron transfer subunit [Alkalicoccobacillus murimartini]